MKYSIVVGRYSAESGLRLEWVPGYLIDVAIRGSEVTVTANAEGLRSLAQHLLTLAEGEVPVGVHVHLEPGQELEDNSASLILDKGQP